MLAAERQKKIVELINLRSSMRVTELSEEFSVTEETIRRDLEKLEKNNELKRSHGGAVTIKDSLSEIDFNTRQITNIEEKQKIANEAVKLVKSGDRIILDASTTAWYMSKIIPDIPLVVITNSLKVAMELSQKEQVKIISTGGILLPKSLSLVGPVAEDTLDKYHVTTAFISSKGVNIESGLTDSHEQQALVKKKMLARAKKRVLMVDSSKFNNTDFATIANLNQITDCITDDQIDEDLKKQLQKLNVNMHIVSNFNN